MAKIPDSLKVAYKTANGRVVYDGGGINPDIEVEPQEYSSMLFSLVNSNMFFDYATDYHHKNKTIASPRDFELTDEEYQQFATWLNKQDVKFDSEMDHAVKALEKMAVQSKYYDGMKSSIDKLKDKVSDIKENFTTKYKSDVKFLLEEEIISRYYLHTGTIEASLDKDLAVLKAAEVLRNKSQYNQLLAKK